MKRYPSHFLAGRRAVYPCYRGVHKVGLATGLLVPSAYFFADSVPKVPRAAVARNRIEEVRGVSYALDGLALRDALQKYVLPWFGTLASAEAVLAVLDSGNEFDVVTAALMRIARGDSGGEKDLLRIYHSAVNVAWKERYRSAGARLSVELPPAVEERTSLRSISPVPVPGVRRVEHATFGQGAVTRELEGGAKLEVVFDGAGRKIVLARFLNEISGSE